MNKRHRSPTHCHGSTDSFAPNFTAEMWQLEVSLGNECFSEERFLMALSHYHQAIRIADALLVNFCNETHACRIANKQAAPGAIVAMLLVSYHNLADLYLIKHEFNLAEYTYQQANEQLITALQTIAEGSVMHLALLSGINRNRSILQLHQKEHGKATKQYQLDTRNSPQIPIYSTLRNIQ